MPGREGPEEDYQAPRRIRTRIGVWDIPPGAQCATTLRNQKGTSSPSSHSENQKSRSNLKLHITEFRNSERHDQRKYRSGRDLGRRPRHTRRRYLPTGRGERRGRGAVLAARAWWAPPSALGSC